MLRWRSDSTLNVIKNFNHSKLKRGQPQLRFPLSQSSSCSSLRPQPQAPLVKAPLRIPEAVGGPATLAVPWIIESACALALHLFLKCWPS